MSIVNCRLSNEQPITIDLFGVLTRLAGAPSVSLSIHTGATIAEALGALVAHRPDLGRVLSGCACAIGDTVVPRTCRLVGGERLALLPPVSGG